MISIHRLKRFFAHENGLEDVEKERNVSALFFQRMYVAQENNNMAAFEWLGVL